MKNYERIKNMTVEEMENFLLSVYINGFMDGAHDNNDEFIYNKKWLEREFVICAECRYYKKATTNSSGDLFCQETGKQITEKSFCEYGKKGR